MAWDKLFRLMVVTILILMTTIQTYTQHPEFVIYTPDTQSARDHLAIQDTPHISLVERETPPAHITPPQTIVIKTDTGDLTLWLPMIDRRAIIDERSNGLTVSLPPLTFIAPLQATEQQFIIALASYGSGDCTRIESLADTSLPPVQAYFSGNCALIANDLTQANQHYETAVKDSLIAPYAAINAIWLTINTGDETAARAQITTRLATDYISRRASVEQADLLAYRARLYALLFDYSTAIADLTAALELQPDDSRFLRWLGEMHMLTYEWDQAEAYFSQAIIRAPYIPANYYQRGILLYTMARRDDALIDFWQAYSLAPLGELAQPALRYIDSIQREIDALQSASD